MTLHRLAPAVAPLDLAVAKLHARIDGVERDALLPGLLLAATEAVEHDTGRALLAQEWRQVEAAPCVVVRLGVRPVLAVLAVADDRGVLAAEDYIVSADDPGHVTVAPADGTAWQGAVRIDYRAGFGAAPETVPAVLVTAVALRFMALVDPDQAPALERAAAALAGPWRVYAL